jgi:hypothetical protein
MPCPDQGAMGGKQSIDTRLSDRRQDKKAKRFLGILSAVIVHVI